MRRFWSIWSHWCLGCVTWTLLALPNSLPAQTTAQRGGRDPQDYLQQGRRVVAEEHRPGERRHQPAQAPQPRGRREYEPPPTDRVVGRRTPAQTQDEGTGTRLSERQPGTLPARPAARDTRYLEPSGRELAGVDQTAAMLEQARRDQIELMLNTQAEIQYWNEASGYGLNGVVPLDAPYRYYVGPGPTGFPATYLNVDQHYPLNRPWLYPPSVYLETGPRPTGFETIVTGPNSYVYRPTYDDPMAGVAPPPAYADVPDGAVTRGAEVVQADEQVRTPADDEADWLRELFRQGRYREVIDRVNRVMVRYPRSGKLELIRSQTYFAQGDFNAAAQALQRALRSLPPQHWGTIPRQADEYYESEEQYARQLDALETYLRRNPRDAEARFLLGYHLGYTGYAAEAAEQLAQAHELGHRDEATRRLRELFELAAEKQREAESQARQQGDVEVPPEPVPPQADGPREF